MKTPEELVLQLETVQIEESLRLSGLSGNMIPGTVYLFEQMKGRGWNLDDAKVAFDWIRETERSLMNAFRDYGGEG